MKQTLYRFALVAVILIPLSACTGMFGYLNEGRRTGESTSLVAWLYPRGEAPPPASEETPVLNVPLRVGLAFVPPSNPHHRGGFAESDKHLLLQKVKQQFETRPYVSQIVIIPQLYLQRVNGIPGMQQVARTMNVDVMALVSYDQVSHNFDSEESLLYWTILGAYIVQGSQHEVHTFVDLAVLDVNTGKFLVRAPGISKQSSKSNLITNAEHGRHARERGLSTAMDDMSQTLDKELVTFKERIKTDKSVKVAYRSSWGGGSSSWGILILLFIAACERFLSHHSILARANKRFNFQVLFDPLKE